MFYDSRQDVYSRVQLSGNGVHVSFRAPSYMANNTLLADWSPDQTCIPFGQIEDLKFEGASPTPTSAPIYVFALKSLRVLRVAQWDEEFAKANFCSLHPDPGAAEVPCRFLQEIEYTYWESQLPGLLVSLVRERKRAGYQLRLVSLMTGHDGSHPDLLEMKEHVGEVRTREWNERV